MGLFRFFKKKQNTRVEKIMDKDYYATLYMQKIKEGYNIFLQKQIKYDEGDEDLNRAILLFNRVYKIGNIKEWFASEEVSELQEYINENTMNEYTVALVADSNFDKDYELGYLCYKFYDNMEDAIPFAKKQYLCVDDSPTWSESYRRKHFVIETLKVIVEQAKEKETEEIER